MKSLTQSCIVLITALLLTGSATYAQKASTTNSKTSNQSQMKTYVIERNIPGAGNFTPEQLQAISQTSCGVLDKMGPQIRWDHSYVVGDKIFCIYEAANEELLKEHGKMGGFPVDNIYEVKAVISPATARSH